MWMYVYVYILLNGVNAYLTFGTGFSFFHFSPLFDCLFFRLSFFAVPFFGGNTLSTRSARYDSSVHTRTRNAVHVYTR